MRRFALNVRKLTFRLPIRFKIVALIMAALIASLVSYIYIGTSLVEKDKVSYIYDHTLSQVQAVADAVENQVSRLHATARLMAWLITQEKGRAEASEHSLEKFFTEQAEGSGILSLLVFRPEGENHFALELALGSKSSEAQALWTQLGWTPSLYSSSNILIGNESQGFLPIGGKTADSSGKPIAFMALTRLDPKGIERPGLTRIRVVDSLGKLLHSSRGIATAENPALDGAAELEKTILSGKFASGVRDWTSSDRTEQIMSYQQLKSGRLTVFGYTPKAAAFEAVRSLTQRSTILGLSILMLSIGLSLLFARTLTSRLVKMWHATQRISEGDFSNRLELKGGASDELSDLATSFNTMTDKINELMEKTAEKARLQNELETAQIVQSRLFPTEQFEHPNLQIAGQYMPASECGGDWWSYAYINDHLVLVIGDVTGHGASSALITAVAHGAFSVYVQGAKDDRSSPPDIKRLLSQINEAVYAASKDSVYMTFLGATIDLRTGEAKLCNASHCTPYIYRPSLASGASKNPLKSYIPIVGARGVALGYGPDLEIEPYTFHLEPGDLLFCYTDGLVECENPKNQPFGKNKLLKAIAQIYSSNGNPNAPKITSDVFNTFLEFLGTSADKRADDVTVVTLAVAPDAPYQRSSTPPSSAIPPAPPTATPPLAPPAPPPAADAA